MTSVEITPAATAAQSEIANLWTERVWLAERYSQADSLFKEAQRRLELSSPMIPSELILEPTELVASKGVGVRTERENDQFKYCWMPLEGIDENLARLDIDPDFRGWLQSRRTIAAKYNADLDTAWEQSGIYAAEEGWENSQEQILSLDDKILKTTSRSLADLAIKARIAEWWKTGGYNPDQPVTAVLREVQKLAEVA